MLVCALNVCVAVCVWGLGASIIWSAYSLIDHERLQVVGWVSVEIEHLMCGPWKWQRLQMMSEKGRKCRQNLKQTFENVVVKNLNVANLFPWDILCIDTYWETPPRPPASYELYCELGHFQNDVVPIKLNADSIIVAIIAVLCPCVAPLSTAVIELLKFQRTYVSPCTNTCLWGFP